MDDFLTPLAVAVSFVSSCLFLSGNEDGLVELSSERGSLDSPECEAIGSIGVLAAFLVGMVGGLLLGKSIWNKDAGCRDRTRDGEEREISETSEDRPDDLEDDNPGGYPVRVRKHIEKKAAGLGTKFQPLMSSVTVKSRRVSSFSQKSSDKSRRSSWRFGVAPALGMPMLK